MYKEFEVLEPNLSTKGTKKDGKTSTKSLTRNRHQELG